MICKKIFKAFHLHCSLAALSSLVPLSVLSIERLNYAYDLTVVGLIQPADGIGQIAINIIDCLKNHARISCMATRPLIDDLSEVSSAVKQIVQNTDTKPGKVAILTDIVWDKTQNYAEKMPQKSLIKIAYSMLESSRIPPQWVNILNKKFDAVIVPDAWHLKTYKNSGVKIPLFVLPIILPHLEELLKVEPQFKPHVPFVFGTSAASWSHKNQLLLIKAFAKAFAHNPHVKLVINSRGYEEPAFSLIQRTLKELNLNNILFTTERLAWKEYVKLMQSFDCLVNYSKGEGFSIGPREALALGKPVILSDNSAHQTLCRTGYVKSVLSNIPEKAYYKAFDQECGYFFDTPLKDATSALIDVYDNYSAYVAKAQLGKKWVKKYLPEQLKGRYLTALVRPKKLVYGASNSITGTTLTTNSLALYRKYQKLMLLPRLPPTEKKEVKRSVRKRGKMPRH